MKIEIEAVEVTLVIGPDKADDVFIKTPYDKADGMKVLFHAELAQGKGLAFIREHFGVEPDIIDYGRP